MIIHMRGSAGSGKSYVGFKLLEEYPPVEEIVAPPQTKYNHRKTKERTIGYVLPGDLAVLGTYTFKRSGTYSGGLEAWTWKGSQQDIRDFIEERSHQHRHVYFEGLLLSMSIQPYLELARKLTADQATALPIVFAFLNTPRQVCHDRIMTRNKGAEIKVDTTVNYDWKRIHKNVKPAYDESEFPSLYVPYERSFEWTRDAFLADGWSP